MSWIDGALVGFDTETTGIDVAADRIVTAAVVRHTPDSESITTWLIDPGIEIPAAAAAIHGITTENARAHGRRPVEALDEIAQALSDALLRDEPVVAFNASFDLSLLESELRRHHLPTLADRIGRDVKTVIDPLVLDRHLDRFRRGKRQLGDLCNHYAVTTSAALHTADVDVLATLEVLRAIARAFPEVTSMPLENLHNLQVTAHRTWAEHLNAWRTKQGLTGPGAELTWPMRDSVPARASS